MAGFIKILPLFMMVMPGMISRIKYPGMKNINTHKPTHKQSCEMILQNYVFHRFHKFPNNILENKTK